MEFSLAQRIIIKLYSTKFKVIQKFSPQKAAASFLKLFFTPYLTHRKAERPAIFHKAEKLSFPFNGFTIRGFRWKSQNANAKTILVCHGMNSCAYRFERYVQLLMQQHFNVLAFDAQGHGQSEGKFLNAALYSEIIIEIEKHYGPLNGIIAHSVGGMATSFAMEKIDDPLKKVVLIAPATETTSQLDIFFRLLNLPLSYRMMVNEEIYRTRGLPPEWYSTARAVNNIKADTLWIHDTDDLICPYSDTLKIQEAKLPNVKFITTSGLGHNKIYRDAGIQKTIIDFLIAE